MTIKDLLKKVPEFKSQKKSQQVLLVIYYLTISEKLFFSPKDIEEAFTHNGLIAPGNIIRELGSLSTGRNKCLIKKGKLYSLELYVKSEMDEKFAKTEFVKETTNKLSSLLSNISDKTQKSFLEDAIKCFNGALYRPAIIMTWLLTMDILIEKILSEHKNDFNLQLQTANKKVRIKTKDDFEDLKESEIINFMRAINMLGKEQAKILLAKLDIRNSAAHPNNTTFREAKVATFIEELIEDIIIKFQ